MAETNISVYNMDRHNLTGRSVFNLAVFLAIPARNLKIKISNEIAA
jgi:hypothetical protein